MTLLLSFLFLLVGWAHAAGDATQGERSRPGQETGEWRTPAVIVVGIGAYAHAPDSLKNLSEVEAECRALWSYFRHTLGYPMVEALCDAEHTSFGTLMSASKTFAGTLTGQPLVVIWTGYGADDMLYLSDSIFSEEPNGTELTLSDLVVHLKSSAPEGTPIVFVLNAAHDPGEAHRSYLHGPTAHALSNVEGVLAYSLTQGDPAPAGLLLLARVKSCWNQQVSDTIRADRALDAAELGFCLKREGAAAGMAPAFAGDWREQTLTHFAEPEPLALPRTPLLERPSFRYTSFAVGGAALIAGATTNAIAVKRYKTFDDPRTNYAGESEYDANVAGYHRLRYTTYALYAISVVGLSLGTTSVVLEPGGASVHGRF